MQTKAKHDLNRELLVDRIVECFADMGGTPDVLIKERQRLMEDDPYLIGWNKSIILKPEGRWQKLRRTLKLRLLGSKN